MVRSVLKHTQNALVASLALVMANCSIVPYSSRDLSEASIHEAVEEERVKDNSSITTFIDGKQVSESDLEKMIGAKIYGKTDAQDIGMLYIAADEAKNTELFSKVKSIFFLPSNSINDAFGQSVGSEVLKISKSQRNYFSGISVITHEAAHSHIYTLANTSFWNEWDAVHPQKYTGNKFSSPEYKRYSQDFTKPRHGFLIAYDSISRDEHAADFTAIAIHGPRKFLEVKPSERFIYEKYLKILEKYKSISAQHSAKASYYLNGNN